MPNEAFCLPGSTSVQELLERQDEGLLPRGWIDGLTLSNNAGDATNDIDIAPGAARSTVNKAYVYNNAYSAHPKHQRDIEIYDTVTKQLDVLWAPGNGGGRSISSLANGTWHVFGIGGKHHKDRIFLHDSAVQSSVLAALPGGYTAYRRIGSVIRASASIRAFSQFGDDFLLTASVLDADATNPGTSAVLRTMTVPTGVKVVWNGCAFTINSGTSVNASFYLSSPDQNDEAASGGVAPLSFGGNIAASSGTMDRFGGQFSIRTNTSGQLRSRLLGSDANVSLRMATHGWTDFRGKDS